MELLGRKIVFVMAGILLLWGISDCTVKAKSPYPILYDQSFSEDENYIIIKEDPSEYEVAEGDSLWKIAERTFGDGRYYTELIKNNQDILQNPDLIYPGMILEVGREGYIEKEGGPMGMSTPEFWFDFPTGWTVGYLQSGEVGANLTISGSGMNDVACLIQKRMENTVPDASDWEKYVQQIKDHVQEKYSDSVSELSFEHYQVNGEDLYLYSYIYTVDGADYGLQGTMQIHVCAALRLTEHIQAEYIGFSRDEEIDEIVRYMGASFEELEMNGELSVGMAIFPDFAWEAEGMYDSFSWIAGYFDAVFEKATEKEEEKSLRDRLLDD